MTKKFAAYIEGGDTSQRFYTLEEISRPDPVSLTEKERAWLLAAAPGDSKIVKGGGYYGDDSILIRLSDVHVISGRRARE